MDKFANLPTPVKWVLGVLGLGGGLGAVGFFGGMHLMLIFALVLVVVLIVLVGGYFLWNVWRKKQASRQVASGVVQDGKAVPAGMSAEDQAKLDSLQRAFREGIDVYRSKGKDLYSVPWYVVVGEPGSGKTEAVRHSGVLMPGMNDPLQGTGGTINMNWWFTEKAVVLDTAGRLMFKDVRPGETSEWVEFLKLLKKTRPHEPINGLLLVIPADSLIKNSGEEIAAKAGKIAQQLNNIQDKLDFRFPVSILVTKSDLILGFREFFDSMTDPTLQQQMLGWTNKDPLDAEFNPKKVEDYLAEVTERLKKRRLGLLRDWPESEKRRIDEVDSLFALPESLLKLAPRLRRYMETVFMRGEWSPKPLFLRGIYFTSSLREGAALDAVIAEAFNISVAEIPDFKEWTRDRAYFLRDLFMEKVFPEKGLVTRATNTGNLLKRRRMILYASVLVALLCFIVVFWLGKKSISDAVSEPAAYWAASTNENWGSSGAWNRPAIEQKEEAQYGLSIYKVQYKDYFKPLKVPDFQKKLRDLAETPLTARWFAGDLPNVYNKNSKPAQKVMFDTGVLLPLKEAVQKRMTALLEAEGGESDDMAAEEALLTLLRTEVELGKRNSTPFDSKAANSFLMPLVRFAVGNSTDLETNASFANLASVMARTYAPGPQETNRWPEAWFSFSTDQPVRTNMLLMEGLEYFIKRATNTLSAMKTNQANAESLRAALISYQQAENNLLAQPAGSVTTVLDAAGKVKERMDIITASPGFQQPLSLVNQYARYINEVQKAAFQRFEKIKAENKKGQDKSGDKVFSDIARRLQDQEKRNQEFAAGLVSSDVWPQLTNLDVCFLVGTDKATAKTPPYQSRSEVYQAASKLVGFSIPTDQKRESILKAWSEWNDLRNRLTDSAGKYEGCEKGRLVDFASAFRNRLEERGAVFFEAYARAANAELGSVLGFPVLKASSKEVNLDGAKAKVEEISAELDKIAAFKLSPPKNWAGWTSNVGVIRNWITSLQGQGPCKIQLLANEGKTGSWRNAYRALRLAGQEGFSEDISHGQDVVPLGSIEPKQRCLFQLAHNVTEKTVALEVGPNATWGVLRLAAAEYAKMDPDSSGYTGATISYPIGGEKLDCDCKDSILRLKLKFDKPLPQPWLEKLE